MLQNFYEGLMPMSKGHVDAAAGGAFLSLTSGMDLSEDCWKFEIFPLRALVLPMGKNFTRNVAEHLSHVLTASFSL